MWRARLGEPSGSRCPILTKAAAGLQANLCFNARQAVWIHFPRLFHICLCIAHVETGSVLLSRWVEEGWEKVKEFRGGKNWSQTSDPLGSNDTAWAMAEKNSHWAEKCG